MLPRLRTRVLPRPPSRRCRRSVPNAFAPTSDFCRTICSKGRGTGQRGGDIAAEYIATQFALYGLKPAGDNGTYLQKVPMVGHHARGRDYIFVRAHPSGEAVRAERPG